MKSSCSSPTLHRFQNGGLELRTRPIETEQASDRLYSLLERPTSPMPTFHLDGPDWRASWHELAQCAFRLVPGLHEIGSTLLRNTGDKIDDRPFACAVVPRWKQIDLRLRQHGCGPRRSDQSCRRGRRRMGGVKLLDWFGKQGHSDRL
jgi:hypothetical protein